MFFKNILCSVNNSTSVLEHLQSVFPPESDTSLHDKKKVGGTPPTHTHTHTHTHIYIIVHILTCKCLVWWNENKRFWIKCQRAFSEINVLTYSSNKFWSFSKISHLSYFWKFYLLTSWRFRSTYYWRNTNIISLINFLRTDVQTINPFTSDLQGFCPSVYGIYGFIQRIIVNSVDQKLTRPFLFHSLLVTF